MPVFNQNQKTQEHDILFRYSKRLYYRDEVLIKKATKKKSSWHTPCPLKHAVSLKKKNKMNFGLTPLSLELLCNNNSRLPTHTPALRARMMASKPNTRVAGETCGRLDWYRKHISGTLAIWRAHSLAGVILVEHHCRHHWHSPLEHWYSIYEAGRWKALGTRLVKHPWRVDILTQII